MKKHFRKARVNELKRQKEEIPTCKVVNSINWKKKLSMQEYCELKKGKKVKFRSRRKAFQFKLKLNVGKKYKVYQCDKCQKWHLTKLTPKQYEEKKAYYNELYRRAQ